jgi:hypothetical protein
VPAFQHELHLHCTHLLSFQSKSNCISSLLLAASYTSMLCSIIEFLTRFVIFRSPFRLWRCSPYLVTWINCLELQHSNLDFVLAF